MAGATFRGTSTASGTGTSIVVSNPAGYAAGDALFAIIQHDSGVSLSGRPGGTSIVPGSIFGNGTFRLIQWDTPGAGPWTFTLNTSSPWSIIVVAVTPANPTDVLGIDVLSMTAEASNNAGSVVIPSVTTLTADDLVVYGLGWNRGTTFAPPGGTTERAEVRSGDGSTDHSLWLGTEAVASVGATGTRTVTNDNPFSAGASRANMMALALKSTAAPTSWVGDFESGDLSQYAGQNFNQAPTDGITRVQVLSGTVGQPDGPYEGTKFARIITDPEDVYPATPTANPRAQIKSPRTMGEGETWWVSWASRLPADFPYIANYPEMWLLLLQIFGSPFSGSPPIALQVMDDKFALTHEGSQAGNILWTAPVVRDAWQAFVVRAKFSVNPAVGWIEFWFNGKQQLIGTADAPPVRRFYTNTLPVGSDSRAEVTPALYHKLDGPAVRVSMDIDAVRADQGLPPMLGNAALLDRPVRMGRSH